MSVAPPETVADTEAQLASLPPRAAEPDASHAIVALLHAAWALRESPHLAGTALEP